MPSPFPGMDPYLEDPEIWPGFHSTFLGELRTELNRHIRPDYVATLDHRVYITNPFDTRSEARIPDVTISKTRTYEGTTGRAVRPRSLTNGSSGATAAIESPILMRFRLPKEMKQLYVSIRERKTKSTVTVIELLSPSNKLAGSGARKSFLRKRRDVLNSPVNWVEIDLLRKGKPTFERPESRPDDLGVFSSPGRKRTPGLFWFFSYERPLPIVGIPLRKPDGDVAVSLQSVFASAYDVAAADALIDYAKPPYHAFTKSMAVWANQLVKRKR